MKDNTEIVTRLTQQKKVVKGVVIDENNAPIVGANITEIGTKNGTETDSEGRFTLNVEENAVISVSYVGYLTQNINTTGRSDFSIVLHGEAAIMDAVVAIGYGTMRKRDLTGSIVSVKSDVVENERPKRIGDFLRGNAAGLDVGLDVSAKGGDALEIRGDNTLKTGSSPLIVLDGIIYNGDMANLNPNDIESIDILKDASSAAIYGARSANGVILITTKNASISEKPVINFSLSYGVDAIASMAKVRDHIQFMEWRQDVMKSMNYNNPSQMNKLYIYDNPDHLPAGITLDMWRDGNQNDPIDIYLARMGLGAIEAANYKAGKYINWGEYIFQNGKRQDYNISIAGRANKAKYYWSVGYEDNIGNVIGERYKSIRSLLKLESNVTKWLAIGINSSFARRNEGYVPVSTGEYTRNSPYGSRYQDDGVTLRMSSTNDPVASIVPDYDRNFTDRRSLITNLTNNLYSKIKLPLSIDYEFNFAPRFEFVEYMNHQSALHQEWSKRGGLAQRESSSLVGWEINNIFKWNKTLRDVHSFDLTFLYNAEQRKYWWSRMSTENFSPSDVLGYHNMGAGNSTSNVINSNDEYSTANAMMGRLFYMFDKKYMLTLSLRRDGYSAFGLNHPYGVFPSMAIGWQFSEEEFLKNNFLTYGKLRFSWGENGNRGIGIYDALSNMTTGKYPYQPLSGNIYEASQLYVSRMANYDLRWERTQSYNLGIDFSIQNDMLSGSIDLYKSKTLDLLVDRKMTNVSGFTSALSNMGEVDNDGLEISLGAKVLNLENCGWSTFLTFAYNRNRIVHLYGNMKNILDDKGNIIGSKEDDDLNNGWFIGRPIDQIWNYQVLGVWQMNEANEAKRYGQFPGDFRLLDKNDDGKYNDDDKEFLGFEKAPVQFSMRHNFNFLKDFSLSFLIYSKWNYLTTYNSAKNSDNFVERANSYNTPYWTPENPINDYSRIRSQTGGISFNVYRERSFIRMDNVSLAYNLSKKATEKIKAKDIKVIGSIRNVFCWAPRWPENYWDPETLTRAPRSFIFGLNITL